MIHSRQITYNLHKVVFLLDKITDDVLQKHLLISFSLVRIMMAIQKKDAITQNEIAQYWEMTDAAVSRQVETLIEKKFIFKEENSENRRQHLLTLTALGKKQLQKAMAVLDETYESLFTLINQKERQAMVEGLHKLMDVVCPGEGTKNCTPNVEPKSY